jgi:Transposase DDE domain group 1
MRSSHNLARVETTFDDDWVVPNGGLQAPAALAQKLGIAELIDQRVKLPADAAGRANAGVKAMTSIGAMLTGGDSIDDVAVLRAGAAPSVFTATRAASTIGVWLRGFIWATVRMLDAVSRVVLARAWAAGLGPDLDADLTIDVDSTICQTYGTAKQGARFGYTKVRGYHPLLATLAATGEVLHARMRGGNAGSARGAGSFIRETIRRVRDAGATGALTVRADSAFYSRAFVRACRAHDARFSVTVKLSPAIRAAIAAIPDDAWTPIPYWLDGGADVAETTYTAFKGTKDQVELRLIVRRVRPTPGSQLALDVVFDYHPFLTDRAGETLELEADHRAHAGVELDIRDLKAGGLAHVPSGVFFANAAWLALAVLAHNLGRWTLRAAGGRWADATTETLRTKLVATPARLVRSARTIKLRFPRNWPWRDAYDAALTAIRAIPAPT